MSICRSDFSAEQAGDIDSVAKRLHITFAAAVRVILDGRFTLAKREQSGPETVVERKRNASETLPGEGDIGGGVLAVAVSSSSKTAQVGEQQEKQKKQRKPRPPIPIPPIPEDLDTPEWQGAVREWLVSKAERGHGYKPQGLKSLFTQLRQMGPRVGVPSIIRACAGEWQGIKRLSGRELEDVLPFARPVDPEIDWRIAETWADHVYAYRSFLTTAQGAAPEVDPVLTAELRAAIEAALRTYDGGLLGPQQRAEWEDRSIARAAGVGQFYSEFHTGKDPRSPGGVMHLGHDLPWRNGNVQKFADLHFALGAAKRKAAGR